MIFWKRPVHNTIAIDYPIHDTPFLYMYTYVYVSIFKSFNMYNIYFYISYTYAHTFFIIIILFSSFTHTSKTGWRQLLY